MTGCAHSFLCEGKLRSERNGILVKRPAAMKELDLDVHTVDRSGGAGLTLSVRRWNEIGPAARGTDSQRIERVSASSDAQS